MKIPINGKYDSQIQLYNVIEVDGCLHSDNDILELSEKKYFILLSKMSLTVVENPHNDVITRYLNLIPPGCLARKVRALHVSGHLLQATIRETTGGSLMNSKDL